MKKSRKIKLVLISAALVTCSKSMQAQMEGMKGPNPLDTNGTAGPVYQPAPVLCCQEAYLQIWNYAFNPFGITYIGPVVNGYYYPGSYYRRGAFWRGHHFIVRGGWGRGGHSASS